MNGRHEEDALARGLKADDLDDDGERLDDEQAAHYQRDDLRVGEHGDGGKARAQRKRTGIAHEDACRIGIEP